METTLIERRFARMAAGAHRSMPVEVVTGGPELTSPKIVGRSYYWTTPTGKPVAFPNAYNRKAYRRGSKAVYHPSTLRVEVTRAWLFVMHIAALGA